MWRMLLCDGRPRAALRSAEVSGRGNPAAALRSVRGALQRRHAVRYGVSAGSSRAYANCQHLLQRARLPRPRQLRPRRPPSVPQVGAPLCAASARTNRRLQSWETHGALQALAGPLRARDPAVRVPVRQCVISSRPGRAVALPVQGARHPIHLTKEWAGRVQNSVRNSEWRRSKDTSSSPSEMSSS
jgi:hypothetical protein